MAGILIVYGSKYGQTQKIAEAIGNTFKQKGRHVDVQNAEGIKGYFQPESYDLVVVGGPVYAGKFPKPLRKWVTENSQALNKMPAYFFSVCLGVLQADEKVQREETAIVQRFFDATGFKPKSWKIFAGALPYLRYNWITKFIMKRITAKAGGNTDTSKNHEYTNWDDVAKFAETLLAQKPVCPLVHSAPVL